MKTTREKFKSGILVLQSSADMQQEEFFMLGVHSSLMALGTKYRPTLMSNDHKQC